MTIGPGAGAGAVFTALADTTRRRVVEELAASGGATATQLAAALPISRQAVGKHLATLAGARMVNTERRGREVRYQLVGDSLVEAMQWMAAVGLGWDRRLEALAGHARAVRSGADRARSELHTADAQVAPDVLHVHDHASADGRAGERTDHGEGPPHH